MQRNSVYVFLGALILLCCCSSRNNENGESDSLRQTHTMIDTATAVTETAEIPAQLPVINREHYHTVEIKQVKF